MDEQRPGLDAEELELTSSVEEFLMICFRGNKALVHGVGATLCGMSESQSQHEVLISGLASLGLSAITARLKREKAA